MDAHWPIPGSLPNRNNLPPLHIRMCFPQHRKLASNTDLSTLKLQKATLKFRLIYSNKILGFEIRCRSPFRVCLPRLRRILDKMSNMYSSEQTPAQIDCLEKTQLKTATKSSFFNHPDSIPLPTQHCKRRCTSTPAPHTCPIFHWWDFSIWVWVWFVVQVRG